MVATLTKEYDWINNLWKKWQKGIHKPNITWPSLIGLYQWFLRECERREIDPQEIDFEAYVDPALSYEENKTILAEMMRTGGLSEKEAHEMYETWKANIEDEIRQSHPEIFEPLEKRLAELEHAEVTSKKRYKKIQRLERELSETKRKLEEEKTKPPEVASVKIRILKPFSEGIIDYTSGSIVETKDIDWVLNLIRQGLAERVTVEVPVEVKPKPKPPEKVFKPPPKDRETYLTDVFYATLSRNGVPIRTAYRSRWRLELPTIMMTPEKDQEHLTEDFAKEIVREYQAEKIRRPPARPPPRPVPAAPPPKIPLPPGWKKVVNGYLTPAGEFIPEAEFPELMRKFEPWRRLLPPAKPPGLNLKNWLRWAHGLDWGDFLKLSDYERKILQDEYQRLSEEEGS